jgi:hypothetical protein
MYDFMYTEIIPERPNIKVWENRLNKRDRTVLLEYLTHQ